MSLDYRVGGAEPGSGRGERFLIRNEPVEVHTVRSTHSTTKEAKGLPQPYNYRPYVLPMMCEAGYKSGRKGACATRLLSLFRVTISI